MVILPRTNGATPRGVRRSDIGRCRASARVHDARREGHRGALILGVRLRIRRLPRLHRSVNGRDLRSSFTDRRAHALERHLRARRRQRIVARAQATSEPCVSALVVAGGRAREVEHEGGPATGRLLDPRAAAVFLRDERDEREAETEVP